jgi:AraC family transcriptional regulator
VGTDGGAGGQTGAPPAPAQYAHERDVLGFVATRTAGLGRAGGAMAAIHEEECFRVRRHAYEDCHTLTFQLGGTPLGRLDARGRTVEAMRPGTVSVQPAPIESLWHCSGRARWMQFYLPTDARVDALDHEHLREGRAADLDRRIGAADRALVRTLYACAPELSRLPLPDEERIEEFALALAGVLARQLAGRHADGAPGRERERLSRRQLAQAIECIEALLHEGVTASQVARHLGLSRDHFARAFTGATGKSPYQYIQHARLASAAVLVSSSERPLLDIAASVGYATQAHMTSAFSRFLGASPGEVRALGLGRRLAPRRRGLSNRDPPPARGTQAGASSSRPSIRHRGPW